MDAGQLRSLALKDRLAANSPKAALKCALQLGLIDPSQEADWLSMLDDRNLTSHTYRHQTAVDVTNRVLASYTTLFGEALARAKQ